MYKNKFNLRNVVAIAICLAGMMTFFSCEKDNTELEGNQSPIGKVGNSGRVIGSITGVSNPTARVVSLEDGVSSIAISARITDANILRMIPSIPSGGNISVTTKLRITSEGAQNVYPEGNLTFVKYNAKVGDVYTIKRGARTIRREVTVVSNKDEFQWNNMLIKTIHVRETSGTPGLDYVDYVTNHKFGLVAIKFGFEDGTTRTVFIDSGATN